PPSLLFPYTTLFRSSLVVGDLPVRSGHDRSAGFEEKFGFPAIPARHDMANPCSAIRLWRGFILSDSNPSRGQSLPWCTCASSIPEGMAVANRSDKRQVDPEPRPRVEPCVDPDPGTRDTPGMESAGRHLRRGECRHHPH